MAAVCAQLTRHLLQPFYGCRPSVRMRSKINIKHPKPGPLERRILVEVTKPVYLPVVKLPAETCTRRASLFEKERDTSKYEQFLIRFARNIFEENQSGVIGVCHRMPMSANTARLLKVMYSKAGFTVRVMSNAVVQKALQDTKWANLAPLFISHNLLIVSPDFTKTKLLVEMARKSPEISLLGGVVHNQILSRADLERYTKLPDKSHLLGELVGILNGAIAKPSLLLQHHQMTLASLLAEHSRQAGSDAAKDI